MKKSVSLPQSITRHYEKRNIHNRFGCICTVKQCASVPSHRVASRRQCSRDAKFCVSNTGNNASSPKSSTNNNSSSLIPHYKLLPNPNHGNFTVEITYPEAQDVTVAVYDSDGRLLLTMNGRGQHAYRFENSVPTAGHYHIDITSPSEHKTLKMVVN